MSDDMSEMIQKMSEMLKNNEIPDNIKSIMNNLASSSNSDNSANQSGEKSASENTSFSNANSSQESNSNFSDMPNIDLSTMLKMKSIIDSMNQQQNDPRANLLRSLKPYLKPSRKEKVDQYIKLFGIGKAFETFNILGGESKNDV